MEQLERFKKAIEYLKTKAEKPTNDAVSKLLRYKTPSYISDVIGGSKPINDLLLDRMVENSINKNWIETGKGKMLLDSQADGIAIIDSQVILIELKTASGKTLKVKPEGASEIALLNAFLEERDRVIETLKEEKQARIDELIKEKENLNSIIKGYLEGINSNSKEIAEDISALTDEIQAEHRAMMDSIDVAAKQPIGTTRGAAHSVELASQQKHVSKGKAEAGK